MQQIALSEATAARRRIVLPRCVSDADGVTEQTGLTFSASEIKISKAGALEANSGGSVVEMASGYYYYEPTAGEVDTRGFFYVRLNKSGTRVNVVVVQVGAEVAFAESLLALTDGIESGLSLKHAVQDIFATTAGKSSGAGTGTENFRNKADTLNRVTVTISGGNRTAVTHNHS